MQTIVFNTKEFELAGTPNVLADRFQATIIKGFSSIDEIMEEADNTTTVKIMTDGVLTSVYKGYNHLFALNIIKLPNMSDEKLKVSIELENTSMQNQINQLHSVIRTLQNQTAKQFSEITSLTDQMSEMTEVQSAVLEDLGETVSALAEAQETQNQALEDIGTTLNDIANTESEVTE